MQHPGMIEAVMASVMRGVSATVSCVLVASLAACDSGSAIVDHGTPPPATQPSSANPSDRVSTSAARPGPPTFTVVMSGDVLLHEGLWATARNDARREGRRGMDFRRILAGMRPDIAGADLAICHLETPLAPKGGPYSGYPVFAVPPAIVPALAWAGYDACTTASNHTLDQGFEGLRRTLRLLDAYGLAHAGSASTKADAKQPLLLDANGVRVALISETYGTNGIPIPSEQPWSVPIIDVQTIEHRAQLARQEGAQVVIVALHWGDEYVHQPSAYQTDIARQLAQDDDIDLIYGHHAHVVQPFDRIHGTWVAYGLGNAVAQQETDMIGVWEGITARFTFTERPGGRFAVTRTAFIPTFISSYQPANPRMRWLNIPESLDDNSISDDEKQQMRAALTRIKADVNMLHARSFGLMMGR
jgi:poly-gamma-glutamate capsule biosynthesis protein CapA/YwtB (metallophosphatase superfamily)